MAEVSARANTIISEIFDLFLKNGKDSYIGEAVSQIEHALQSAWIAEQEGSSSAEVVAALLHDVGHLLHDLPENIAEQGIDDRHESLGAAWLENRFGPEVCEPVKMHVDAKRFLSADPDYFQRLSPASVLSLGLQGGPFDSTQLAEFKRRPFFEEAIRLRRRDDEAKIPDLYTPDLEHFRKHFEAVLAD